MCLIGNTAAIRYKIFLEIVIIKSEALPGKLFEIFGKTDRKRENSRFWENKFCITKKYKANAYFQEIRSLLTYIPWNESKKIHEFVRATYTHRE